MDVVTYYTIPEYGLEDNGYYEEQAGRWNSRIRALGHRPIAIGLPTSASDPAWLVNCRRKAPLIAALRRGRPLLWLDVDDDFAHMPDIPAGVDVAGIPSSLPGRVMSSCAVYLAGTRAADAVVREWVRLSLLPVHADKSDEWALNKALRWCGMHSWRPTVGQLDPGFRRHNESKDRGRYWPSSSEGVDHGATVDG